MTVAQMLRNHVTSGAPGSDQARADHHGHIGRRPTARHPQRMREGAERHPAN